MVFFVLYCITVVTSFLENLVIGLGGKTYTATISYPVLGISLKRLDIRRIHHNFTEK